MANETPALPAAPQPQFRLNGQQILALHLIEMAQTTMGAAADRCASAEQTEPQNMLIEAIRVLDSAKLSWLRSTQNAVQLVPDLTGLPARIKANGGSLGG